MIRSFACFSAVLLTCFASLAQSPAPAPTGATTTASPEVLQFQKIEDSWSNALNEHDQYGLELVLSPLFVDVSASGDITTRNQQVAQAITGEDKTLHIEQKVITVRMLGDIAVANGTYGLHHKVNSAQVDEKGVFTHVYERVRDGWMCINSQRTSLRNDANTKSKKAVSPESPFHFPLFK
jgi:ketosteroid isomerase-like protein